MKFSKLGLFFDQSFSCMFSDFSLYNLPTNEPIRDFYSTKDFTLLLSYSGELWEIGSFVRNSLNKQECHSLNLKIQIVSICSNNECSLLLSESGRVYGWGVSNTGILGNLLKMPAPTLLSNFDLKKINKISISNNYAGCIDEQGSVFLWGTFTYTSTLKSTTQLTTYKDYSVKEIVCNESFVCICTDGGFLYFIGKIGCHSKTEFLKLDSFEELEEMCVLQIASGKTFVGIINDNYETFVFDGCKVITKLPCVNKIHNIIATDNSIIGLSAGVIHKWSSCGLGPEKFNKSYCPLKNWEGKVYKLNNSEVLYGKSILNGFGLVFSMNTNEVIKLDCVKEFQSGWNRGSFIKIIENDSPNVLVLFEILQKLTNSALKLCFFLIKQKNNEKTIREKMIHHTRLPNTLVNIYSKYYRRSLMISIVCIKNELKLQDFIAKERIKIIRNNTKIKQEAIGRIFNVVFKAFLRNKLIKLNFAFECLNCTRKLAQIKEKYTFGLGKIIRKAKLRIHLWTWWNNTRYNLVGSLKLMTTIKHFTSKRVSKAFSAIKCFSAFQKFSQKSKNSVFLFLNTLILSKKSKFCFNTWKSFFLKQNAQFQREQKNYEICVKLGCKYLFKVMNTHLFLYWNSFKTQSFKQAKVRYKHFSIFLSYFIKKKLSVLFSFLPNKSNQGTPDVSSSFSNQIVCNKEDSGFLSSSVLFSLNVLLASHKKMVNLTVTSPKVPKLILTPNNKSRLSSTHYETSLKACFWS